MWLVLCLNNTLAKFGHVTRGGQLGVRAPAMGFLARALIAQRTGLIRGNCSKVLTCYASVRSTLSLPHAGN